MERHDAFALGRSNLNRFLFADIGLEASGMPLSVISALARQGLDPWQEATRLAKLPPNTATDGLARLIAALPASLWPLPDATAIAARLVALLPGNVDRPTTSSAYRALAEGGQRGPWLVIGVLLMALVAGVVASVAPAPAPATVPAPGEAAAAPPPAVAPLVSVPTSD